MKNKETIMKALKLFDELPIEYVKEELIPQMQTAVKLSKIMKRDADREVERRVSAIRRS